MTNKRLKISFIALFICIITFIFSVKAQDDLPDLVEKIKPSVISITTYDKSGKGLSRGSGFCVATNQILTSKHVIEGAFSIKIHTVNNRTYNVLKTISVDETGDLALLQTENLDTNIKPLVLANYSPREGEKIIVVGNPLGLEGSVSDGIVSAFRDTRDLGKLIQITAPISPGSSGSPVINIKGEVIGVATLNLKGGQNLNFAISSERLIYLWENLLTVSNKPASLIENKQSIEDLYERGLKSYEKGNFSEALLYFQQVVLDKPNYASAYLWAGVSNYRLKQYEKSIKLLNQAIQLESNLYQAYHYLGLVYYENKLYGKAISSFEYAIKLSPDKSKDKATSIYSLGLAYKSFGDRQAALDQQKQLESIDTDLAKKLFSLLSINISGYWLNPTSGYWNKNPQLKYKISDDGEKITVQYLINGDYTNYFEAVWYGDLAFGFSKDNKVCYTLKKVNSDQVLFTPIYSKQLKIKDKDSQEQILQKVKEKMRGEYLYTLTRLQ